MEVCRLSESLAQPFPSATGGGGGSRGGGQGGRGGGSGRGGRGGGSGGGRQGEEGCLDCAFDTRFSISGCLDGLARNIGPGGVGERRGGLLEGR